MNKEFYLKIIDVNITNQILANKKEETINNFKYVFYE